MSDPTQPSPTSPEPTPLRLTQVEGEAIQIDPSLSGHLPASMKADTDTDVLGVIMANLGNTLGSVHVGVEIALAGYPTDVAERERLALLAEERVKRVIADELKRIGEINVPEEGRTPEQVQAQISTEFGLLLAKALMEDLLPRIPAALVRPNDPGLFDPAPDTTL